MDNEQNIINCVRIFADCGVADSPLNANTRALITINSGDSVRLDISLLKNGKLAECSDIASVSVEILDIGALNEALPRTAKLLLSKTVASSAIDTTLTAERFAAGANHFSVSLTSAETALKSAYRYLKICAYDSDGNRTTFAAGWIYIRDILSGELSDDPETSRTLAEELGAKITALSAKTDSVSDSLSSLDGEFAAYKTDANSRISAAQTDISGLASSVNSLETSKAQKATSLSGYGIADAYTKTEVDSKNALDLKKASNLSDLPNKATARSNLNVYSKSETYAKTETYSKDESYPKTELYTKTEIDSLSATAQQQKTQLGLSKTPQGFLAFTATGTTQAVLAKQTKLTKAFSLCFTFIAPDSVPTSLSSGTWICYSLGDLTQVAQVGIVFQWVTWWDNKPQKGVVLLLKNKTDISGTNNKLFLPYSTISDGKPHAVAIIASPDSSVSLDGNNGKFRAYVDGVLKASIDAFVADTYNQNSRFTFSNTFGRLARMCRFNFDISAADAPYTLADYTSGKAIPAALNAPFSFSAGESTWEPLNLDGTTTPAPATISVENDVITITTTAEIAAASFRVKPTTDIAKGDIGQTLRASIDSLGGFKNGSYAIGLRPMLGNSILDGITLTNSAKSGSLTTTQKFDGIQIVFVANTNPIPSDTVFTVNGLRVWLNGAVVALDDYTFGGKIRDISDNDNHATVSTTNGVRIHGDKDEAVQQMYEAFSAQYTTDNP